MNQILKDLLEVVEEFDRRDTIEIDGAKIRLSRAMMVLPCNRRGELVGLDMEVLNFHAQQQGMEVVRSIYLENTKVMVMEKTNPWLAGNIFGKSLT